MSFASQLFSGWGSALFFFGPMAAIWSALLALPSAGWSRYRRSLPDWIGLLLSIALALGVWLIMFGVPRVLGFLSEGDAISLANVLIPTFLMVVAPQWPAYVFTRNKPLLRPLAALLFSFAGAVIWVIAPVLMRITPD